MNIKPKSKHYVVFSIPERNKIVDDNGNVSSLFTANSRRGAYSRVEDVWVYCAASDVPETLPAGTHAYVSDAFELEPTDLKLWDAVSEQSEFADLKAFAARVEGVVKTRIVHYDSLLAVNTDSEKGSSS